MKTGIQVSSFKPVLTTEQEVDHAFSRMADMGCDYVQLQWIDPGINVTYIGKTLKKYEIQSVSVQDFFEIVNRNTPYYTRLNMVTGGTLVTVSRIPEHLKSREGLDIYAGQLRSMNQGLETVGQKLCLHPVMADFVPIDGLDPVEYLLDKLPELLVCADLYHLHKSGKDMIAFLNRYAGRIPMVHFKDYRVNPDGKEELVPAGQGVIDWSGVVETCLKTGVEYAFVEQERWRGDPFARLEEALSWLADSARVFLPPR